MSARLLMLVLLGTSTMLLPYGMPAQGGQDVTATIRVTNHGKRQERAADSVVVWLTPLDVPLPDPRPLPKATLVQKNKEFQPHLLVIPTGTMVDFPNLDPFFHNVFSMFNGKRFDLGLYESGSHRSVRFDREGVSFIFCNIHPEMGAVVIALRTPFYGVSDAQGHVTIHDVPRGHYHLNSWSERFQTDSPQDDRIIKVEGSAIDLGMLPVEPKTDPMQHHKNKFGEDYPQAAKPPY